MDAFSYHNIFQTKGIEYIIVISFLILIVPFWQIITKPIVRQKIKEAIVNLSEKMLRIPKGLFYSKNHTWSYLQKSGNAFVGLDDLLVHITGEVDIKQVHNSGDKVKRGDVIAEMERNGKQLSVTSPLSGELLEYNSSLEETPSLINKDPYENGWLVSIKPDKWTTETRDYYMGEDAENWEKSEFLRFKDFCAESISKYSEAGKVTVLQEGGEMIDNPLAEMPGEVWKDFQKKFLSI